MAAYASNLVTYCKLHIADTTPKFTTFIDGDGLDKIAEIKIVSKRVRRYT
jgi:hypothetical protein